MERTIAPHILKDLSRKIIFLTGPRQCGKTTLAKMLGPRYEYLNFDDEDHRLAILEKSWDRKKPIVIFDELHKFKNWKGWLKGIFDTEGIPPAYVVTGSAKLDTYKKVGDSLAGRYFQFRLHPLDVKEIVRFAPRTDPEKVMMKLLDVGGFPEPYLEGSTAFYNRWKRSHSDIILKQDLPSMENVREVVAVETLILLLRKRVGNPVSYTSLAEDLQVSDKTIKRWLEVLERMYILFKITPYHRNIARSLLKTPKYYFYDTAQVIGNEGDKLENLVACALFKEIHFRQDCLGEEMQVHYLRNKNGDEIDFCVIENERPRLLAEVKWADSERSPGFAAFSRFAGDAKKVQVVGRPKREKTYPDGLEVRAAPEWLANLAAT